MSIVCHNYRQFNASLHGGTDDDPGWGSYSKHIEQGNGFGYLITQILF